MKKSVTIALQERELTMEVVEILEEYRAEKIDKITAHNLLIGMGYNLTVNEKLIDY